MATELPKVSPHLLDRGPEMCRRRLAAALDGRQPSFSPFTRWRIRDPLVAAAEAAQTTLGLPEMSAFVAPAQLVPEERVIFDNAAEGYVALFSDSPAEVILDHGCQLPTLDRSRGVRLGGGVDLVLQRSDGPVELRQLELWGRRLCGDPALSWTMLVAVLRLGTWAAGRPLVVVHADPLKRQAERCLINPGGDLAGLGARLDDRLALVMERAADPVPEPGPDCGACGFIADCPALRS